ncbi:MAG: SDR family oxidoreductase [Proteobacteria bacterium]|nr:SDR family oxidoreductase [Pseudomonadota bacterium]
MYQSIAELYDLKDKSAVVTGGSMGIGQAIALRLAQVGANVMIADINLDAANETVEQIKSAGGQAQAIRADVSSVADAKDIVQTTVKTFGRLDILINNAGIYPLAPLLEITEEMWDRVNGIDLKGVFFCSQAAAHEMLRAGRGGKIVNIASIDALHPNGINAHYNAAKAGVVMLTKALALELAPHGILVNSVAPGTIMTPGVDSAFEAQISRGKDPKELAKIFKGRLPLGRSGQPDEIAKVVLFLTSAAADYMTGTLLVVDGGYLLS